MKRYITVITLALLSYCCFVSGAKAQASNDVKIAWFTFDAGGSSRTTGLYTVSGSIGYLDVSALTAGAYSLQSGFWSGVSSNEPPEHCTPLTITSQPRSVTNTCPRDCATFSVSVSGSSPITAQWYHNRTPIAGATGPTHSICPVSSAHAGTYSVVLSNACSTVYSERVFLTVMQDATAPRITCPSNIAVMAQSASGANVSFAVTAEDDSAEPPTVTCTPASGSLFPIGSTTVTCVATDRCGNQSRCEFKVDVMELRGSKLSIARTRRGMVLTWDGCGILEETDTLLGQWKPVEGANSPYAIVPLGDKKFYRVRPCAEETQ